MKHRKYLSNKTRKYLLVEIESLEFNLASKPLNIIKNKLLLIVYHLLKMMKKSSRLAVASLN